MNTKLNVVLNLNEGGIKDEVQNEIFKYFTCRFGAVIPNCL